MEQKLKKKDDTPSEQEVLTNGTSYSPSTLTSVSSEREHKKWRVTVVVAAALLVLAGGLGWWIVTHDSKSTIGQAKVSQPQTQQSGDQSQSTKYLIIAEWGVRFALPAQLQGDVYYRLDSNETLGAEFASFASHRLDGLTGDDSCTFKNNPQNNGLSARLVRGDPAKLTPTASRELVATLDGLAYYRSVPEPMPITCTSSVHPDLYETEQAISEQLRESLKTLEKI